MEKGEIAKFSHTQGYIQGLSEAHSICIRVAIESTNVNTDIIEEISDNLIEAIERAGKTNE